MTATHIITWRKPAPDFLDWDHAAAFSLDEAKRVVENIKAQGVKQWHTFEVSRQIDELSKPVMG